MIDFRHAPATSWTLICRPDDPHKTLVRQDGALLYGYEPIHPGAGSFRLTVELRAQTAHSPISITQRTEDARTPVVVTTVDYPSCRLELRSVGHLASDGHRYDVVTWSIRVNDDVDELLTGLHLDVSERGAVRHMGADTAPDRRIFTVPAAEFPEYPLFVDERATPDPSASPSGVPVLISDPQPLIPAFPTGFRPASGFQTIPCVVRGGQTISGALVLPLDGGPTDLVDAGWAAAALAAERAYWHGLAALDLPIRVAPADVQDMLVASARNILQAREHDAFQVGPAVYRGMWIADGHFLLEAAQYLHLAADARRGAAGLLGKVRPDGSINALADLADEEEAPHTKETGIAVATLVRQWELTGDDAWLREVWPVVRGGVRHIADLRARPEAAGLMPPAFADGGAAGVRPELTTALWTLAGLRYALRAAHRLFPGEVAEIEAMAKDLQADIARVAKEHGHLPMVLPGSGLHHTRPGVPDPTPDHRLQPQTATWALAQVIWPGEVFAQEDRVVTDFLQLIDRIEEEGIPASTGWLPYRAVWTYYASFAAHVQLYAGRPERAVELLYGMCNHAAPTRVWREEQALAATGHDQIWGDMPHNWASAELIRLVRHLAVFETGDELHLLPGIPEEWLAQGPLLIDRTPTRFGAVTLKVSDHDIELAIDGAGPRRCLLHLPEGEWRVGGELHRVTRRRTVAI